MMGLVDYGSSGESSDSEDEGGPVITINGKSSSPPPPAKKAKPAPAKPSPIVRKPQMALDEDKDDGSLPVPKISENFMNSAESSSNKTGDFHISDDEDEIGPNTASFLDSSLDDKGGESDIFSLISKKLPASKQKASTSIESFVDRNEDTSDIVKKVDYGDKIELPPAKKKKKDGGPVKISIPSLRELHDAETEAGAEPKPKITASKKGSGLMALLPTPVNKTTRRPLDTARPETGEEKRPGLNGQMFKPADSTAPARNNLKPTGVRSSGLVPHVLAKSAAGSPAVISKPPAPPSADKKKEDAPKNFLVGDISDSESDEDMDKEGINSGSYFPGSSVPGKYGAGSSRLNTAPEPEKPAVSPVYGLKRPPVPPPIVPADPNFISFDNSVDADSLGPAVSVYPPPAPSESQQYDNSLVDNEEAIARLAGKAAKRREFEDMKIIDVHEDQMRGDPNVWLTKAMTEEQAPRPDRKAGPKGLAKSKHQITYLAHMAKERDWELRQEWSQARANKRASMNKYGFC